MPVGKKPPIETTEIPRDYGQKVPGKYSKMHGKRSASVWMAGLVILDSGDALGDEPGGDTEVDDDAENVAE